jgi:16S rRNA (guanine1207-N2)-methyltransferase
MTTVKRPTDPHYKATLEVALHGARLRFHVAQDLFSSAALDPGTAALLRTLADVDVNRVLDLGCGYGPLALFLKAWRPDAMVHAVDRDGLAVRYTRMNAAANDLDVTPYPSLGYDDVAEGDFDLIVSNIPAKAGPRVIESLLLDGSHFLAPGGRMAVVVIDRIAGEVRAHLPEPELEWSNRGYTVFHYGPRAPAGTYVAAFDRGVYDRGRLRYEHVDIATVWGLPEFDTPSYATQLAVRLLPRLSGTRLLVRNPGQGVVPAAARSPVCIEDRDLLALRTTARNAVVTDDHAEALVALLRENEPLPVTLAALAPFERALVAGSSTQVTRVIEATAADVVSREKTRGFSAAIIAR